MAEDQTDPSLNRLRVLRLEDTPRARLLRHRWLYYQCRQNDGMSVDTDGYEHTPGFGYLQQRMRGMGYVPAVNSSIPFGQRRPSCHTTVAGHIVDTYTALLLGEGRQPAIRVVGDEASTDMVGALMQHCGAWSALGEARKVGGAEGATAVLPEIVDGVLALRTLRPENLYVEWTNQTHWIPRLVIEQKKITIEGIDERTGQIVTYEVWRSRAWDETYSYAYTDKLIESDGGPDDEKDEKQPDNRIELSEPPKPHGAGRCPVIWIQNTQDSDNPVGEADCEPVFEMIDQLDRSQSMLVRGSRANTDPTLMIKDTPMMLRRWPNRAKGYGAKIEVSPQGDAKLLEIQGESISTGWETVQHLLRQIERRTGVIQPDPENSGAFQSGVALQILWQTQHSRAAERRTPLGVGIKQLVRVVLALLRTWGLKPIGAYGEGVEVPPRVVRTEDDAGVERTEYADHELGEGGAIVLDWPGFHQATPQDLQTTAQGLSVATAGGFLSKESATAHMVKVMQTDTDCAEEAARIEAERATKIGEFDEAMRPDVEGLAEGELAEDGEPFNEGGKTGMQDRQEAMNGIQVKTLGDSLARAGEDLAPQASKFVVMTGFPSVNESELDKALAAQLQHGEKRKAEQPEPPTMDPQEQAENLAKTQAAQDVPEPREPEDTGEMDEAGDQPNSSDGED